MIHKYIIDKEDLPKLIKGEELPLSQGSKARAFMIEITGNLTNGDMIKALFPQIKMREHNEFMFVVEGMAFNHETYSNLFFKDWWNAPYNPPKQNLAFADKSGLEYADQPTLQSAT